MHPSPHRHTHPCPTAPASPQVRFVPGRVGAHRLHAWLGGEEVDGSPATVVAVAGPADAARSHAHGRGLTTAVAGRAAAAVVRAYDACGNETLDELLVTAQLRYLSYAPGNAAEVALGGGGGGGGGGFVLAPPPRPRVHVGAPRPPGTVPLAFTPLRCGELEVAISLRAAPLAGSPFIVAVVPADAAALHCALSGAGLSGGVVRRGGETRGLSLRSYDAFGNRCTAGGAEVSLSLRPRDTGAGAGAGAAGSLAGTAADKGDGCYALEYKVSKDVGHLVLA